MNEIKVHDCVMEQQLGSTTAHLLVEIAEVSTKGVMPNVSACGDTVHKDTYTRQVMQH